jgi:hypothetical protein
MSEIRYEIRRRLAVLSTNEKSGWTKEANVVSWNGGAEKLDIREWKPDHSKMSKGITLTEDEARTLALTLTDLFR